MLIHRQTFYERFTGESHLIEILFYWKNRKVYEVHVDDEFYSTAESKGQAFDELADIIKIHNWTGICPI